jgi:hypothetical protein
MHSRKGPHSDCEYFKKNQVYKYFCDQCFMQFDRNEKSYVNEEVMGYNGKMNQITK